MERFDRYEDDPDQTSEDDVTALAFEAGYGQAILDRERASSDDAWGDRIVEAASRLSGAGMWDDSGPRPTEDEW